MEESLEQQLREYDAQLGELVQGLEVIPQDDPGYNDLLQLFNDVQELIQVTEAELLAERKARLLRSLEGPESPKTKPATQENVTDQGSKPTYNTGDLVQVTYRQIWGGVQMFHAMVMQYFPEKDQYAVHFLTPTHKDMKTCPHFLRGTCRFNENCTNHHGYSADAADISEYNSPDYGRLKQGSSCLAEYADDSLWYPATILNVDTKGDEVMFTVKFRQYHSKAVLPASKIHPYGIYDNGAMQSSSSSDDENEHTLPDHISNLGDSTDESDSERDRLSDAHKAGYKGDMAKWEGKSLRPGSLLMPVKVEVIPSGMSLDVLGELRQKRAQRGQPKDKLGSENTAKPSRVAETPKERNVFDFLNSTFAGIAADSRTSLGNDDNGFELRKDQGSATRKESTSVAKGDPKEMRKELFMLQEQIRQIETRLSGEQQQVARNLGRDKAMAVHAQEKVKQTQRELQSLTRLRDQLEKRLKGSGKSQKSLF